MSAMVGGLIVAVVISVLPAAAGNGGKLVLGTRNRASAVTTLTGKGGLNVINLTVGGEPAAWFKVKSGPPFAVNSDGRVRNLNADLLDGKHASSFLPRKAKAANSEKLDGLDSTGFLRATARAANSDKVDGYHANELVRAALAQSDGIDETVVFAGGAIDGDLLSVEITTPVPGILFAWAGTDAHLGGGFDNYGDLYSCALWVDNDQGVGQKMPGSLRTSRVSQDSAGSTDNRQEDCSTSAAMPVEADTHTMRFRILGRKSSNPTSYFTDASLQVLFVPFDGNGKPAGP